MKNIYKFLILTLVASGTMFYSCETIELEKLANPIDLTSADPDLLLNRIQIDFKNSIAELNFEGGTLGRVNVMGTRNYFARYGSGTVSTTWNNLYADILPDVTAIELAHSADNDLSFHLGAAKAMQATLMMNLVDYLGDIVFSQANNPGEFPSPALDDDAAVYDAALALLDEAKAYMTGASAGTATDMFFGGSSDKWIKYINTMKMRADLTVGNYPAVINATNVMSSNADDMEFRYGTQELGPDTRHPDYNSDYRSDGSSIYHSNWLMSIMAGTYGDFNPNTGRPEPDPRRRFYWYRQSYGTPGNYALINIGGTVYIWNEAPDGETLQCSLQTVPSHLEFTPDEDIWCSVQMSYWGRSHGNDEGTPPDSFLKTASGVYPAGGSFDDNPDVPVGTASGANYDDNFVTLGGGGGGAGIEPIMLASFVDFYRAEAYLHENDPVNAATYLEAAITKSIAKVQSFGSLDGAADGAALANAMDPARISSFIASTMAAFNAAPMTSALDGFGWPVVKDKMDILGEQLAIAQFGAGNDMFNFVRRTGHPRTYARSLEGAPGLFPRSVLYPGDEVSSNPSIDQKTDLSTQVFWDQGVTNPAN
ncbi:MAG: SusD/RagB family nutrient-binding outer membrane lipoprotein [Flavobacteriaceae bacterium]|nr:SusD/RagB family nutrient-binding outer membrane lipoprotein [Flavobacteriaceae bacterium]